MKVRKRCGLRAAGDYLLHSLLVGRSIGMKFICQSDSILNFPWRGSICFRVLYVFQETCICHDHLQPTNIFSCSCHTGPLVEFPVQPPHQEDLNLPTFVKIGEPTDEDFFFKDCIC